MITTLARRRMESGEYNLEVATKVPPLELMLQEMEEAQTGMDWYLRRNDYAYDWAHSRWDDQTLDGRKWNEDAFPWEGASDARLRTVGTLIQDHVSFTKWAYLNAKVQAQALRPAVHGRESNKASLLLHWVIYTQMRGELQREMPLAWWWKYCYGAAILKVGWRQSRRLEMYPLKLADLVQMVAMSKDPQTMQVLEAIVDPAQEDAVATFLQGFSEILAKDDARKIVKDLREKGEAQIPVSKVYEHRPTVTALRPGVEILFPTEMDDPQSPSTRWMAEFDYPTETQLRDRIQTDNYDPKFVEEALQHKGEVSNEAWLGRTLGERESYYGQRDVGSSGWGTEPFKNRIELVHFYRYQIEFKTPCLYHTIFSPHVLKKPGTRDAKLYAWDGPFEYDHGQMPFLGMRRQTRSRSLLSSIGIAEEAYTDEQAVKAQWDGVTDRTSIVNKPPMAVPTSRVQAIANEWAPGKVLGVNRKDEISWPPLPPFDQTPFAMMEKVTENLDWRYPLFPNEKSGINPEKVQIYRQEVANDSLIEVELAFTQIFQLLQQFKEDQEVEQVVGQLTSPFHVSREEIRGAHNIIVSVNTKNLSDEYIDKMLSNIMKLMPLNQGGTANTNKLFKIAMEIIEPDLADAIEDEQPATEREKNDELGALNSIMNGIEPDFPRFGNHRLRLQTLTGATIQSPNPEMQKRLAERPDSVAMLKNRIKLHQRQIQQQEQNPQIGRMLGTQTFDKSQAPEAAGPQG